MTPPGCTYSASVRDQIVEMLPNLRAFSRTLVHDSARADDLVQDTVLKAFANIERFQNGTNLQAWLFTILRNTFYSQIRKRHGEVEDVDGQYAANATVAPDQMMRLDARDFRKAMAKLNSEQREALILVGPAGCSYEEAAEICGCAVGTIKSRVNRARLRLSACLEDDCQDTNTVMEAVR
ncbi:MAG: sigma-70 family RNA polymerase sigma factor [Defluviicoccus sp.]